MRGGGAAELSSSRAKPVMLRQVQTVHSPGGGALYNKHDGAERQPCQRSQVGGSVRADGGEGDWRQGTGSRNNLGPVGKVRDRGSEGRMRAGRACERTAPARRRRRRWLAGRPMARRAQARRLCLTPGEGRRGQRTKLGSVAQRPWGTMRRGPAPWAAVIRPPPKSPTTPL